MRRNSHAWRELSAHSGGRPGGCRPYEPRAVSPTRLWAVVALAVGILAWGANPARAQSTWNLYDNYTSTIPINFINPMGPAEGAYGEIYLNMSTVGSRPFVMDTGSVGIAATPENFTPKAGDIAMGSGSITYSSSGIVENGTYYLTKVGIQTGAGANTVAATALVKVLQVTSITCLPNTGNPNYRCTPTNSPTGVNFMGVGFDRATTQSDSTRTHSRTSSRWPRAHRSAPCGPAT